MTPKLEPIHDKYSRDSIFHAESDLFAVMPFARVQHEEHPRLSRIEWDKSRNEIDAPDGVYYVLGGEAFPEYREDEGLMGMALLFGFHLATRKLWLFSERRFMTIDAGVESLDQYPTDAPRPLQHWLSGCMRYFLGTVYYYQESVPVMQKYFPGLRRAFPKPPRPAFVSYVWSDFEAAMNTVAEWQAYDRLRFHEGSRLDRELLEYDANRDKVYPALTALCVAVNGLDRTLNNDYYIRRILKETTDERPAREERPGVESLRAFYDVRAES